MLSANRCGLWPRSWSTFPLPGAALSPMMKVMVMPRRVIWSLVLLTGLAGPSGVRAGQFTIDLEVKAGKADRTAHAEVVLREGKPKPRGILDVKAGTTVRVQWVLRNRDRKATFKDVLVHFFV